MFSSIVRFLEQQLKEIRLEEDGEGMLQGQKGSRQSKWIMRSTQEKKDGPTTMEKLKTLVSFQYFCFMKCIDMVFCLLRIFTMQDVFIL